MSSDKSDIEVLNYLGVKHNNYRSNMYAFALQDSGAYYKLRGEVESYAVNYAMESLYGTLFNLMSSGTKTDGVTKIVEGAKAQKVFVPCLPKHIIEEFCLSASKTLQDICADAVRKLLPDNYNTIMNKKFAEIGALSGDSSDPI